jgi:hypothetical protein
VRSGLSVSLEFDPDVPLTVRSRTFYAFQVFAAIYDHPIADPRSGVASRCCFYGKTRPKLTHANSFHIPALYRDIRFDREPRAFEKRRYSDVDLYLSFGTDALSKSPDWLGEIFLWLSSSYEMNISVRDSLGRIPYSETVFSRSGLSATQPHATLLMAWMENALFGEERGEALLKAPSPVSGVEHLVVCSHDIDFYFVGLPPALVRVIKNLAIALLSPSWPYFLDSLKMIRQLLRGSPVGDYIPLLLESAQQCGFRSSFFVVPRRGHRRDPAYLLPQIAPRLWEAQRNGFSVELHGSYRSVIEDRSLAAEAQTLANHVREAPIGNRQHWLRFRSHQELFAEIANANMVADSTLGFPDMVGFRNGASFAFPPYDFAEEKPHRFLEVPLVLMDGSLEMASRSLHIPPQLLAEEVLEESRKRGWGGIAILWHNPMEPLSTTTEINKVFWNCTKKQNEHKEKWMSLREFLACSVARYQQAGLLEGMQVESFGPPIRISSPAMKYR